MSLNKRDGAVVFLTVIMALTTNCGKQEKVKNLDLDDVVETTEEITSEQPSLRFGIGAMISPKRTFIAYREMLNYLSAELKRPVDLVLRKTYAEVNELLQNRELEVAWVCSGPYVDGHDHFGMELLAAPQMYGRTVYYSYIIVRRDSPIQNFSQLRGKTFAFVDPQSNSGYLVPAYMLARLGESADSFFKKYIFTHSHDNSIHAVVEGVVDGAAVDHLIYEYEKVAEPEYPAQTRIIAKSQPFGIPPMVVHPALDPQSKQKLRRIFLNMHKDERGLRILQKMKIDKFVIAKDSWYDPNREMRRWLQQHSKEKGRSPNGRSHLNRLGSAQSEVPQQLQNSLRAQ